MTTAELLELCRAGLATATGVDAAGHVGPAESTAAPAVALRAGFPWLTPNRNVGMCPEVTWSVQLIGNRWDVTAALDQLARGYLQVVRDLHAAGVTRLTPFGDIGTLDVAGVPYVAGTFSVTLKFQE